MGRKIVSYLDLIRKSWKYTNGLRMGIVVSFIVVSMVLE